MARLNPKPRDEYDVAMEEAQENTKEFINENQGI